MQGLANAHSVAARILGFWAMTLSLFACDLSNAQPFPTLVVPTSVENCEHLAFPGAYDSLECDDTLLEASKLPRPELTFFDRLRVFGQIRGRQETDFERIQAPTRNRQRLRMRLGATFEMNSELLIGARMTTGDRKSSLEPLDREGAPLS